MNPIILDTEAVLINNKLIIPVIMLIAIALPLTAITVFATTSTNSTHIKTNNTNTTAKLNAIGQQEAQYQDVQGASDVNSLTKLGYGDCWADSTWLYDQLTAAGIQARIMGYVNDGTGIGYRHAWVEINTGNGWQTWNYTGYNSQHYGDVGGGTPYVIIGPGNPNPNIESTEY
jgi:hypothetical protein